MSDASRVRSGPREVVPVELFFDLVFVFAVSQLSQHLLSRLSWRGVAETAVLLCAVFGVWAYTSFQATVLGPEQKNARGGGPLLCLSAQNWYLARTSQTTSRWHAVSYGALIAGGLAARALPGWGSLLVLLIVLGATLASVLRTGTRPEAQ